MKQAVLHWIDERTGLGGLLERCSRENVLGGLSWGNAVRSAILFLFVVQAITGFFLWVYYSPSAQTAWESVYYLQYQVPGGWLVRGIHHYAAQVMVGLVALYVIGTVVLAGYRSPRELVFWTAMAMGLCAMALCLTGDLLSWDTNSYSATMVRVRFLTLLPVVGTPLFKAAAGGPGPDFGSLTLTRFFALHVGVLAAGLFGLILLHLYLARRAKIAERQPPLPPGPYWPDQAVRNAAACLAAMAVVLLLVVVEGRALGPPGGPSEFFPGARPEWSLRGVYGLSEMVPGAAIPGLGVSWKIFPIFIIPGGLVLLFAAMPFIGRLRLGYIINLAILAAVLVGLGGLTVHSYWTDAVDEAHQAALARSREEAERSIELALHQGIPATGALALVKTDPKLEGARLYEQHCANCHEHVGGRGREFPLDKPTAPNLGAFGTRKQVRGWLDPKKIVTPQYFGATAFRSGDMVQEIKGKFKKLDEEETQEMNEALDAIAVMLSAEARLASQKEIDAKDAALIKQGLKHFDDECSSCHVLHGKGTQSGPELTGYGSLEWLKAIIGNPAHERFYGDKNDGMPIYDKELSPQQIEVVARFIRGEWFEPEQVAEGE